MQSAHGPDAAGATQGSSPAIPAGALLELAALRAVLPGYDVIVTTHSRTHRFEGIRRHDGAGPWCVVSSDPADLWRELAGRARPAALDGDPAGRALLMGRPTISSCPPGRIPAIRRKGGSDADNA